MDFTISPELDTLRREIATFGAQELLPLEADPAAYDAHENIDLALLEILRTRARAQSLWCLQLSPENGGRGLGR